MSQLSGHSNRDSNNPTPSSSPPNEFASPLRARTTSIHRNSTPIRPSSPVHPSSPIDTPVTNSPVGRNRSNSGRPLSIVQTFQPPLMDVGEDTIPELQPIFTFLNSHSNKLYQEGYFLKLDDQNTRMCQTPTARQISWLLITTPCRWSAESGSDMDRVLCAARGHRAVVMGRRRVGCGRGRRRGAAQIYQFDGCVHQDGENPPKRGHPSGWRPRQESN